MTDDFAMDELTLGPVVVWDPAPGLIQASRERPSVLAFLARGLGEPTQAYVEFDVSDGMTLELTPSELRKFGTGLLALADAADTGSPVRPIQSVGERADR